MATYTPPGATHTRDGDFYRVASKVQYFDYGEWNDCADPFDKAGWLEELDAIEGDDK